MIHLDINMPRLFAEGATDLAVAFDLTPGSLTALVGPSGSGKTTLLRVLAGLEKPHRGRIDVNGTVWLDTEQGIHQPPQQRSIGYVFQDTALFPNMTVAENIRYAAPRHQQALVDRLIRETGLEPFVDQKPAVLSGGQRQRVALARALVRQPTLLLLDEPFVALDPVASQQLQEVVLSIHRAWGITTLLVSHYDTDVQTLADRVIRLVQGRVQTDHLLSKPDARPQMERIKHIEFNDQLQQWVIDTDTIQLRSANPDWAQLRVNDLIRVSW